MGENWTCKLREQPASRPEIEAMGTEGDEVQLIGSWASPFVMRVKVAFRLKGVAYQLLDEKFGQKSELLLKSNPVYKKVPILIHAGRPLCESLIIVQYIDDLWPSSGTGRPAILPVHPNERAVHRFWAAYFDDKVAGAMGRIVIARSEEEKAAAAEQIFAGLKNLEGAVADCSYKENKLQRPFFGGYDIGYLDIAIGCMLGWLRTAAALAGVEFLDAERTPLFVGWAHRFCSHGLVKDLMQVHGTSKLLGHAELVREASRRATN